MPHRRCVGCQAVSSVHSSREAGSAQGPPSATERRECKSRVTLLLIMDADSGQIDHMAAEPTMTSTPVQQLKLARS